ncbi:MAG: hypothetical protein KKE02_02470 [Alphaproteobacteria bacterium]|nr:hypothetical protein [Alphaproteobacteria bacterium]MBU1513458.1 hypothetical protein [Alphaproteobacteria bacterium]MBU2096450.1 hypothetical protein [Alphaproteobacteria bacterium]MBU2149858.1 hypothetical protein [Alphaproteobacteria bacterium]MBU2308236.1 hypothetical protein [Alphaproteobacteria bacterium]
MKSELKTAGVIAALGAVAGGAVAIGMGLRLFTTLAMVGLGTGVALGVALSPHNERERIEA